MKETIGISWIYTELFVVVTRRGKVEKKWVSSQPVTDIKGFSEGLFEACHVLGLNQGGHVSIAYESDDHSHEFLELPSMAKKDLHKYLQRRIVTEKPFTDDAAWCYHEARHGKKTEGVLLHLMPKNIVDAMVRICGDFFFIAKRLVPLTEIFTDHILSLKLNGEKKLLLVALFDSRVQMVVAKGNGEILFVRELGYSWDESEGERLVTDADRTLRYAKQRTGGEIDQVILMGGESESALIILKKAMSLPMVVDESSANRFFWATKVIGLPVTNENNFIPKLARRALTRRSALRGAVAAFALLLLITVGFVSWVEYQVFDFDVTEQEIVLDIDEMQQQLNALKRQMALADREKSQLDKFVVTAPDLPVIFFSYLGHLVPKDVTLGSVEIHRKKPGWHFRLTGNSPLSFTRIPDALSKLESGFTAEPWNAQITQSWQQRWLEQLKAGAASNANITGFEMAGILQ